MMNNFKSYLPLALVAVVAASIGWGASAIGSRQKTNAVAPVVETAPVANTLVAAAPQPAQVVSEPASPVKLAPVAKPAVAVKRSAAPRPRVVNQTADEEVNAEPREETSESSAKTTLPVRERKKGMSNKAKTAIAIGGGAATGAIIGGIAGGGKGAAIGAIAGGGGGAIYSVIRKKQGKDVW